MGSYDVNVVRPSGSGGYKTQLKRRLIASWGKRGLLDTLFPYDIADISGALRIKTKEGRPICLSGTCSGLSVI